MNLTFSLSLFSMFFVSSILLHSNLSLSHHVSLSRWHILAWVRHGLLKLIDDGLWFSPMMGCLSSMKISWVLCVVVLWRKRWSSKDGAMCFVYFDRHWSGFCSTSVFFLIFGFCVLCFDRGWSGFCSTTVCVCVFWWDFGRGFAQQLSGFWSGLIWDFFFLIWVFVPMEFWWVVGSVEGAVVVTRLFGFF